MKTDRKARQKRGKDCRRCKATGNLEGEFTDGEFFLTSCSGLGLKSLVVADLDKVWKFVQNETATAIA